MDMHWVIKHLFKKYLQMLLKELSLYHPLQLSCKCKVSLLKGGGRGVENEGANSGPPFITFSGTVKHPSTECPSEEHKATSVY